MMMIIKCALCKQKLFKYVKIGTGRLLHLWRGRIIEDETIKVGDNIKCQCGNLIGIDEKKWIKLKQHSFVTK